MNDTHGAAVTAAAQITDLTASVLDRDTGDVIAFTGPVDSAAADQFIQHVYRANPGLHLTARIELDLNDDCLEW